MIELVGTHDAMIELFSNVIEPYDEERFVHFSPITMLLFVLPKTPNLLFFLAAQLEF